MGIADLSNVLKIFWESSPDEGRQQALYQEALLMTLARASSSDANIDPCEIKSIQKILLQETGQELSEADIRRAARSELYETVNLRKYLRGIQSQLKAEHRLTIVRALGTVIKSDTAISVLEIDFFNRVADALRITPAELAGLES